MHNWTTTKPIAAGAYYIRGFRLCEPDSPPALVEVADDNGELVCNLHESNSEDRLRCWSPIADFNEEFEWLGPLYAAPVAKQVVMPERKSEDRYTGDTEVDGYYNYASRVWNACLDEVVRLNAADHSEGGV